MEIGINIAQSLTILLVNGGNNMNSNKMGKGVFFQRIRRITGYLTGDLKTWNDAKKAEEKDRVKHGVKKDGTTKD